MRSNQPKTGAGSTIGTVAYRILVVDDDPQVLKLFTRILTRGGYEVHTAESGKQSLALLNTFERFDLMVLDLSMPAPDGFEVLKEMRAVQPGLRTLVVSGFMGGALLTAAEILGATATLNKADAPRLLLPMVNQLLQRR
jgi:CheY-like chemotaxis protein